MLSEPLGVLEETLDAAWIAGLLRRRMGADAGVFAEGLTVAALPPGRVTRGALWDASETAANPGVTTMTGDQLLALVPDAAERQMQCQPLARGQVVRQRGDDHATR